ncbi:unnamed protein product [Brassica oleracea]|uniref:Uncharacterized protein n=1 Tax=Brassica oleracea TaxID=3712 RepID=A0A3P6EXF7_BRAOL|nr:unnamed protein product [Brassica oleracea]
MHSGSFPCREKNKLWKTGPRFDEIEQRLPSLEAAVRPIRADKEALVAVAIQWLEDIVEYLEDHSVAG